ncbi:GDSL-type esterase/lipase family protein [Streptomyces sp. NPDC060077]|uniref:GDSL-type esterase/lipase family protein n=1 Tax=Streptomyces sp. NPDC060077 TaxID=3347052 RepID=UPI00365A8356
MRRRSVLAAAGVMAAGVAAPGRASAGRDTRPVLDHRVEKTYDGTSYTDLSSGAAAVGGLSTGTVLVTFRTTSHNRSMTLLSASDPSEPSSNVTLGLSAGALQFSVRDKGAVRQNHLTRTMYDDGAWHTVAVTAGGGRTTFHADGRPVLTVPGGGFFASVTGLTALNIARNLDTDHAGGEWFFTGDIRRAAVYDRVLTEAETGAESARVDLADAGRLSRILNSATPATWVLTGDSITHGARWTNGWRSYVEHFQERIRYELGTPKYTDFVLDTGVSGGTTGDLVDAFAQRVTAFSPQVVSIMLGTNDAAAPDIGPAVYRANLVKLVKAVRRLPGGAVPVLQTPNPIDVSRWPERSALADYARIMREVAAERKVVLVDHHAHWTASHGGEVPLDLLGDGLHPDQRGHLFLAHKMIRDLRLFDPGSRVCSLRIP